MADENPFLKYKQPTASSAPSSISSDNPFLKYKKQSVSAPSESPPVKEPEFTGVHGAIQKLGSLWPESVSPTDIAALPIGVATEGATGVGLKAAESALTRASPRVAQTLAQSKFAQPFLNVLKNSAAGSVGGAAYGTAAAKPGERAKTVESSAEAGALLGGGLPILGKGLFHPIDSIKSILGSLPAAARPAVKALVKPKIEAALDTDTAKEGKRLADKFGLKFSVGETTGNETARSFEDALANSSRYAKQFSDANKEKIDKIVGSYKSTLDTVHPQSVSRADVGSDISKSYRDTISNLVTQRKNQAALDFPNANAAANGEPIVAPNNLIKVVKDYIKEGESPLATPAQKDASKQAKSFIDNLKEKPKGSNILLTDQFGKPLPKEGTPEKYKNITIEDLQNGLAAFGEGAKAGKGIWRALDTASDRRFSMAAKHALEEDMSAAADSGQGKATELLKVARDNYKTNSSKISDIEQTTLGKIIGGAERDSTGNLVIAPEKMADRLSGMEPTELKNTMKFLDDNKPNVAMSARRYVLQKALSQASEGKGLRGYGTSKPFAKAEFVTNLPSEEKLTALLGNRQAAKDVRDVASAINRLIDYGAEKKGSQTAMRMEGLDFITRPVRAGVKKLMAAAVSDNLAEELLNPGTRASLAKQARALPKETKIDKVGVKAKPFIDQSGVGFNNFLNSNR